MASETNLKYGLARWLKGTWPAWLLLVVLAVPMLTVLQPRLIAFLDYWYQVPEQSLSAAAAGSLRIAREQAWLRQLWMIVGAPVGVLLLVQLAMAVFGRSKQAAPTPSHIHVSTSVAGASTGFTQAESTLIREAEQTLIRKTAPASADVTQLRGAGAGVADADRTVIREIGADGEEDSLVIGPNGRYRVERVLASGGMGSVHRGYDTVLHRQVAIKELDVSLSQDEEQTGRFRQEARALAGLAHPYIVPVYDLIEENNRFWIVMELLPGGDLDQMISRNPPNIKIATSIMRAVAEGLAFAHNKGIVHRDIKPLNILFNGDGIPKLVDFGIAKLVQSQQSVVQTRDGLSLGSPTYMSPEQAAGKKDIDKRTDIYALGITFYKMLTGEVPFTGDVAQVLTQHITQQPKPPRELNADISEALDATVLKMLAKNPDERYQSLEDFVAAIDNLKIS